jgi:acetyltransferase-like isoleucine patch superfamily enzyme
MKKSQEEWIAPEFDDMGMTQWGWRVTHINNFKLGKNVEIGSFTMIDARNGVTIEDDVKIGFGCIILSHSSIDNKNGRVILKKNCKISANSVVMPGVEVGEGAIVGSNSLVNRDIPPYEVWFGSPARFRRKLAPP